jgi:hypothetical protein
VALLQEISFTIERQLKWLGESKLVAVFLFISEENFDQLCGLNNLSSFYVLISSFFILLEIGLALITLVLSEWRVIYLRSLILSVRSMVLCVMVSTFSIRACKARDCCSTT